MVGIVGLTILGVIFLLGEFVETNTYRVLNPVTFNLPVALVVLTEIILALLMIAPAVEGIDLFKKGNVVITAEQNSSP